MNYSQWDGTYSLDQEHPTFGKVDWIGMNGIDGAWIKFVGINWVISDADSNVLTHEWDSDDTLHYPPIGTTQWNHQSIRNGATVQIMCSDSYSPSPAPTLSPSSSPV